MLKLFQISTSAVFISILCINGSNLILLLIVLVIIHLFKPGGVSDEAAHILYKCEVTSMKRSGWNLMRNIIPEKPTNLYKLMQLRLIEHSSGPTVKADKQPSSSVWMCNQIESDSLRDAVILWTQCQNHYFALDSSVSYTSASSSIIYPSHI